MLTLHVVQAAFGDSLLLEYGDPPHYLLIDGGPKDVYASALRPKLAEIAARGARLSGVVLTHSDDDHAVGLVDFFSDLWMQQATGESPLIAVDTVWMNSFRFDAAAPSMQHISLPVFPTNPSGDADEPLPLEGVEQALTLRGLVERMGIPLNPGFRGAVVAQDTAPATPPFAGLTIDLLGPTSARLKRLEREWDKWFASHPEAAAAPALPIPAAAVKPDSDGSIPNRASIMFLATVEGRRILFTGDGRSKDVIAGLTHAGLMEKGGALHVDVLKVPHHGSARNASPSFFRRVTADVYVFCANGKDDNPDYVTLEWLVAALQEQGRRARFVATTRTPSLVQLEEHYPPTEWGYTLEVAGEGQAAMPVRMA